MEIASPSQFRPEMGAKAWVWLQRGARVVLVAWPKRRQVDVWTPGNEEPAILQETNSLDSRDVLPGFTYALSDPFGI